MGGPVNTPDDPNGIASVSANGQNAILINIYNRDGTMDPLGCSLTKHTRMGWTQPVPQVIKDFVNLDKEHVDFFLATSGKALLMAVERPDGLGGQDLFVSFPVPETANTWTKPKNLGPNVNTAKSDFAPFLAADEKTLYFASEGRGGYGKSDIFYSKRLDDTWTNWSPPRNLGPVVNSPDFDAYYTISAAGQDAYLVSSRNGTNNSKDIFRISLAPAFQPEVVTLVTGKVLDVNTGKPIRAIIHYENLLTGEEIGVAETDPVDGSYTIVLPSGVQYGYRAEAKGYIAESANLDVTAKDKYSEQKQDLFLVPFNVGQTVKMNNIFFQQSKYYLTTSSYPELLRLIRIMKDYPTVEIKLSGHTDNQGDPALNLKLSLTTEGPRERGKEIPRQPRHQGRAGIHRRLRRYQAPGQQRPGRNPRQKPPRGVHDYKEVGWPAPASATVWPEPLKNPKARAPSTQVSGRFHVPGDCVAGSPLSGL